MQAAHQLNLIDADLLVQDFLKERERGIATMHRMYFKNDNQLSLRALKEDLIDELRTGSVTFINNNYPLDEVNDYLFYIANEFCKKTAKPQIKQKTEYICPGCVFLGKEYCALVIDKIFKCDECASELKNATDPKMMHFFRAFYIHNKIGYHCNDCDRFIPHPIDNASLVTCPYFDCIFVGKVSDLRKMHHPTSKSNPEKLILDAPKDGKASLKDIVVSSENDAHAQLEAGEDLQIKINSLKDIIETQANNVPYSSSSATVRHKQYVYQSISNLLEKFPEEMCDYLFSVSDSNMGFQHKIFQEYIALLEGALPFFISKAGSLHKVDNLLDDSLCLFDGISIFDATVSDRLSIKNGTKEFYIGGRKASYTKPFYIGKLLNVIKTDNQEPLMHLVKDYTFSKIRMHDITPGTQVTVTHLRVPPHYQMGGMSYVNRVRRKIVERVKAIKI